MAWTMDQDLTISTSLTRALGIKYPVILAGMNRASGAKLAAAVTNAGGLGCIGGLGFSPRILKLTIKNIKKDLIDKNAPFGVDFPLAQIGGSARKTNYDYQKGKLDQLIDVVIQSETCKLFVSAIGIPTQAVVDRLHANNILVGNMIGHPKHVSKALGVGVDILIAQGSEGGGHTGNIASTILLPAVVELVKKNGYKSPLTGEPVYVVGAGGIHNGKGLAASLMYGCQSVWVGTRFVACTEAAASMDHKKAICNATYDDTMTSEVYSGRPLRMIRNTYVENWATERADEMKELLDSGVIPYKFDFDEKKGKLKNEKIRPLLKSMNDFVPHLSGQVAGSITEVLTAKQIIDQMVSEAIQMIKQGNMTIIPYRSKL